MPNRFAAITVGSIALLVTAYFLLGHSEKSTGGVVTAFKKNNLKTLKPEALSVPQEKDEVLESAEKTYQLTKLELVKEILESRNDNDPRLDTELKNLDEATKKELVKLYRSRANEDLNGRGTIVFLLGRNIRSSDDFKFFQEVVNEAPCLSLRDCSTLPDESEFEDDHNDGAEQVTLSYPKHVALSSVERVLKNKKLSNDMREELLTTLELARRAPELPIAARASNIIKRISRN